MWITFQQTHTAEAPFQGQSFSYISVIDININYTSSLDWSPYCLFKMVTFTRAVIQVKVRLLYRNKDIIWQR